MVTLLGPQRPAARRRRDAAKSAAAANAKATASRCQRPVQPADAVSGKMSRSKGAGGLADLIKRQGGERIRFFLLRTHYRSTVLFNEPAIEEAGIGLESFYRLFKRYTRITGKDFYALKPATNARSRRGRFSEPGRPGASSRRHLPPKIPRRDGRRLQHGRRDRRAVRAGQDHQQILRRRRPRRQRQDRRSRRRQVHVAADHAQRTGQHPRHLPAAAGGSRRRRDDLLAKAHAAGDRPARRRPQEQELRRRRQDPRRPRPDRHHARRPRRRHRMVRRRRRRHSTAS